MGEGTSDEAAGSGDAGGMDGIDLPAVTAWIAARRDHLATPLSVSVISGGRSNLTYDVTAADGERFVLRRPPLHSVLESAHDVVREARLMTALADSDVPVPVVVGAESDPAVNGAPFYVMEHVDGLVVRDAAVAEESLTPDQRAAASEALIDALVRLHDTDIDEVGLADLARHDGYVERQLRRWSGQLEKGGTRELPVLVDVGERLAADVPAQQRTAIVHGDYRLDNVIVSPDGSEVRAVLDWELCTLGDPMADLGMLHVYWGAPGEDGLRPLGDVPTVLPGFWTREEATAAYAARSDLDLGQLDYYVAFAYWRLAIILEGVFTRFRAGAYEHVDEGVLAMGETVHALAAAADRAATAVGR